MIQYEGSGVPSQISRWPTTTFPLSLPLSLSFSSTFLPPLIARRDPLETNGTPEAKLLLLDDSSFHLVPAFLAPLAQKDLCQSPSIVFLLLKRHLLFSGIGFSRLPVAKVAFRGRFSRRWLKQRVPSVWLPLSRETPTRRGGCRVWVRVRVCVCIRVS